MKWFKHYSNVTTSNAVTEILAKTGFVGYGRYWRLLELMCEKFDGENDEKFTLNTKILQTSLGFYHLNSLRKYLQCIANVGLMSFECTSNVTVIYSSILLELQSSDFKYDRKRRRGADAKKKDIRSNTKKNKNISSEPMSDNSPKAPIGPIEIFKGDSEIESLLGDVSHSSQKRWLKLYPDSDFLKREFLKMFHWLENNSNRRPRSPRGKTGFVTRWLEKGWEQYRKTLTGSSTGSDPFAFLKGDT